jgi:hypothetical protein
MVNQILCYARPWDSEQLSFLSKKILPEAKLTVCSEHRSTDRSGLRKLYYKNLSKPQLKIDLITEISESEIHDIIIRCRLLRNLEEEEAKKHLIAMALAIRKLFKELKPVLVISVTTDSYIIDLIRFYSNYNGALFIGLVGSFVNGYFRLSARGEAIQNHAYDSEFPTKTFSQLLSLNYTPNYNKISIANPIFSTYRRWIANIARVPYFFAKRYLTMDRHNYHYWASQIVAQSHFRFTPPRDPGTDKWLKLLQKTSKPTLYLPLQMFPEATIDYWSEDHETIDYYRFLDLVIEKFHPDFTILIKEHPSVLGSRPAIFYKKLQDDRRVVIAPTYTPSNYILDHVDGVIVLTGSVGFEGMLRGKAVFGFANPYYASGSRFLRINIKTPSSVILQHLQYCSSTPITKDEQIAMLEKLGNSLYKGDFKNDKTWSINSEESIACTTEISRSIRKSLAKIKPEFFKDDIHNTISDVR